MNTLFLITARGGSKGVPGKNIRKLAGKPLIQYTIEAARKVGKDEDICVSSDDSNIIHTAEAIGLKVPFIRPEALASDHAGSYEVILHALDFYEEKGCNYDVVVLLQPTSPFRNELHIREALELYSPEIDMVVGVKESAVNPYFNLFEETPDGFLRKSKSGNFSRRQDAPAVYEYNGAIYVINIQIVKQKKLHEFTRIKKYVMSDLHSVDIDTKLDWKFAELLIQQELIN